VSVTDDIPDDILELVLEGRKFDAISALRAKLNLGLANTKALVEKAEDELGMTERVTCGRCTGTGQERVYKPEYDPAQRLQEPR